MSLEKWITGKQEETDKKKREEIFQNLPEKEKLDLKKQGIKNLIKNEKTKAEKGAEIPDLLKDVKELKDWLNSRTYLQGDMEKIETKLTNIYKKMIHSKIPEITGKDSHFMRNLRDKYNEIPIDFLDEKTRIAVNKRLRGMKRNNSDNYYLRKLQNEIKEKLKEAEYYHILKEILNYYK